ncbi:LuxR C-terminal-related transcriptional regulator [Phenylobacterium sp.]|uniref:helix-turn-helix transcriptional regulator n=1 Tax=Phenylobacterium sp. TaxID=1871053 RepID=UPI003562AEC2
MPSRPLNAMAALRRLAAFGLTSRLAFPEFVGLLADLAPFDTASMLWLGPDYQPIDSYLSVDNDPDISARYITRWFNADEARFYPAQVEMQRNPAAGVVRVSDFTADFQETEIYDEVFRPWRHHWIAGLALFDGPRPIGNLGLGRPPGMANFSDEEMRRLRLARPYIVQALRRDDPPLAWPAQDVEDATAFLVADPQGRIVHASPGAWRLLQGAAGLPADLSLMRDRANTWARPMLLQLAARVADAVAGVQAAPARLETVTTYGRFVVRAYALDASADDGVRAIGVQIEKRLPIGVKMLRSQVFQALTPREQDVAQMLSTGLSYPQIAERMNLGPSTVVTHVRNLGQKLGVGGRDDIVDALSG